MKPKPKTFSSSLKCGSLLFFLVFLQERVFAHGFAYYASTPVTPPIEFRWWWPISMLLLVLGTYIPFRMSIKWSRITSLFMAVLCVAVFATVFFWIGRQVSLSSTAPEPGLGFPCGTYWGRTFSQVGSIFLYWNIFGLFYMMIGPVVILFQSGKTDEKRKKISYWSWILAIPICFVLGLTPYVVQGAWVHGWGGGYVTGQCRRQVDALHFFLLRYALDHDNRLPVAKDFSELYPQLEPYIPDDAKRLGWRGKFDVCVIGKAWSRTPKPFVWNTEMSGKEVLRGDSLYGADIEYDGPVVTFGDGAVLVIGAPWVTCPYLSGYQFLTAGELRIVGQEKIEQLRNYRDIVPVMDEHRP